jgi:hypothetical protein
MYRRDLFWGVATLVAVEPTSLAMLQCAMTDDRSGAAWQAALEPFTQAEFVVSDAAKGIAAGVKAVAAARAASESAVPLAHGLDVFHTNREARRVLSTRWRRAEAAWEDAAAADARAAERQRRGEDARGAAAPAWRKAKRLLAAVDQKEAAWQRARAALAVFRADGSLNERATAEAEIEAALPELAGPKWRKVRSFLKDRRSLTFLDRLHGRLAEAEPNAALRQTWVRRWWLRRQRRPATGASTPLPRIQALLEAKVRDGKLTAEEQSSYDRVATVLETTVRASSAVEGINSVLRMQQTRHRKMTQGLLDLKRLYWNCRRLQTGKRRGQSPYEMLGVTLPSTDFWTLLRTARPAAGQLAEKVSESKVAP